MGLSVLTHHRHHRLTAILYRRQHCPQYTYIYKTIADELGVWFSISIVYIIYRKCDNNILVVWSVFFL